MDLKKSIQALFREIELYRSHSLFEEAKEKCRRVEALIGQNDRIKNRSELLQMVARKIEALEKESNRLEAAAASAQMTTKEQDLVQKLFALSENPDQDSAALQGATAFLVFGQFQKALTEFNRLIERDSLRVVAAKNILRCHIGLASLDDAVGQYHDWLSGGRFPARELESIRSFLEDILEKKGRGKSLPKPSQPADCGPQEPDAEEFIDILNLQLPQIYRRGNPHDLVFDVAYQKGNLISVIIPESNRALVENFKAGLRIDDVQFYSPAVVFRSACLITDVNQIQTGPQKGGYALMMEVLNE